LSAPSLDDSVNWHAGKSMALMKCIGDMLEPPGPSESVDFSLQKMKGMWHHILAKVKCETNQNHIATGDYLHQPKNSKHHRVE
jgi:hypothetical protein